MKTTNNKKPGKHLASVIIPAYNGETFIAEAINSVLIQTYTPVEILVVDDGSDDNTAEVVQSFSQVKYLYQENQGDGKARNTGIEASRGYYLSFLDADDLWEPDKLSLQIQFLENNPQFDYVICKLKNFLNPGTPKPDYMNDNELEIPFVGYLPTAAVIPLPTMVQVGKFDSNLFYTNDGDWFFRAKDAGIREGIIDKVLVHRRIHFTNRSHQRGRDSRQVKELFNMVRASVHRKHQKNLLEK